MFQVVTNATASISDVQITGGVLSTVDVGGAGILNEGSLTLDNVTVTLNTLTLDETDVYGVGVACTGTGTVLNITNSTITDNSGDDSFVHVYGGGVGIQNSCDATISHVQFTDNTGYRGGGMAIATGSNVVTLTDMTFTTNSAGEAGGGLYLTGIETDTAVVVNRAMFDTNHAESSGGGVFTMSPLDMNNASFYANTSNDTGGAFGTNGFDSPLIRLAFVTMVQNTAVSVGGALYVDGVSPNMFIKNSIVAKNTVSSVEYDCYGNLQSADYNYITETSSCGSISNQGHDLFNSPAASAYATVSPSDEGGNIEVLALYVSDETLDIIPEDACTDFDDNPITEDARQMSRPQHTNCELGAYELGQSDPITGAIVVADGADALLSWDSPVASDFDHVVIRRSTSSNPTSVTDGTAVASNVTTASYTDSGLSDGTYYYSIFAIDVDGNASEANNLSVSIDTTTDAPTLTSPASSSTNTSLQLTYTLPETALSNSVKVIFTNGTVTRTVTMDDTITSVDVAVNLANLAATTHALSVDEGAALPAGTYTVILTYRDELGNSAATDTATNILIDYYTTAPTLLSPTASSISNTLAIQYTLPEAQLSNSVALAFDDGTTTTTLTMSNSAQSVTTNINADALSSTDYVVSADGSTLSDGTYTISLSYQDVYGNTAAETSIAGVVLDRVAPVIMLSGEASVTITQGDTYDDAGATATDNIDGDITDDIATTNPVDSSTPGSYTVTYAVSDTAGNAANVITRTVIVALAESTPIDEDTSSPEVIPAKPHAKAIIIRKSRKQKIIKWESIDSATTYTLRIKNAKGKSILNKADITARKYVLTSRWRSKHMKPGKVYLIQIKACNTAGCSAWSKRKTWKLKSTK